MGRDGFRKVPAFVLESLADHAFTARELRVYLACVFLANYTEPRRVRASVATIAQTAGIQRQHAGSALRSLAVPNAKRPAVIEYESGLNQYVTAVVTIVESSSACPETVHPERVACPEAVHVTVHPTVQARTSVARETSPIEPRANRTSARSYDDECLEQQALRIEQAHKRAVDRPALARIASESDLPPERFAYAVTDLVSRPRGTVRSPLALLGRIVEDARADYETELRAIEFRKRPDCSACGGNAHVPVDSTDPDSPYKTCPYCEGSGKEPTTEELLPSSPDERSTNDTEHYV